MELSVRFQQNHAMPQVSCGRFIKSGRTEAASGRRRGKGGVERKTSAFCRACGASARGHATGATMCLVTGSLGNWLDRCLTADGAGDVTQS